MRLENHPIVNYHKGEEIHFTMDGKPLTAKKGDCIAAALIANGIHAFRRTPKLDKPRGLYCGIGQCNDCVVIVNGVPNVRSCVTPVEEGMQVETQIGLGKLGCIDD